MALNTPGTASLKRTTNNPTVTACTLMAWCAPNVGGFGSIISIGLDDSVHFYTSGATVGLADAYTSVSGEVHSTRVVNSNDWHHFALVINGTGVGNVLTYIDGSADQTLTADATATNAAVYVGNDSGGDPLTGAFTAIKIWNAILTLAEIAEERWSVRPLRMANLNSYFPCTSVADAGVDHSTNGFNMTVTGTFTFAADPPGLIPVDRNIGEARPAPFAPSGVRRF